ncbi:MAG: tRNA dihydrouridine synthase DusB, partial [Desulfobulbaceae bacterium]|nr:tRNA dihydrouridine synthase DusB [Desulfobulbaceae bacterium]
MQTSSFSIGSVTIRHPFILAPLAGYTDLPFRILCREYGAGLVYTEMISCHGLVRHQYKTMHMTATDPSESPVALQLFGAEPEIMGEAAAIINDSPVDILDINMGCPVRKVITKVAGCALMRTPNRAREIIQQVVANTTKPVTVKFRTGWDHNSITAPEFAQMAEDAGASGVAIHGRTWTDGFSGEVDYSVIKQVKEKLTIPVIGNGDIHTHDEGLKLMKETGCDGVMIGRAALGAPWIFNDSVNIDPSLAYRLRAVLRYLVLVEQYLPAERLLGKIKNHSAKYFKGLHAGG